MSTSSQTDRRGSNILVYLPERQLDALAAASHCGSINGQLGSSQSAVVSAALDAYLPRLEAEWNDGVPFDQEIGRRLRESRRRPAMSRPRRAGTA